MLDDISETAQQNRSHLALGSSPHMPLPDMDLLLLNGISDNSTHFPYPSMPPPSNSHIGTGPRHHHSGVLGASSASPHSEDDLQHHISYGSASDISGMSSKGIN
jgi:hypothetical protein